MTNTPETGDKPTNHRWPIRIDKKFWNADKIISLSAFVVSIATLLALMYQIRLSGEQNELAQRQQELVRKQQYASLELRIGTNVGDRLFEFMLYNNGVGPAFIEKVRIVYDGQEFPGDLLNFYRAVVLGEEDTVVLDLGTQSIYEGRLIPAGREIPMLSAYAYASSPKERDQLFKWFGRSTKEPELARVEIIYSSVYGERWVVRGIGAIPESLPPEVAE